MFPRYEAGAALTAEQLPRADTFMQLAQNSFNYSLLGAEGFTALAGLVDRTQGYRFRYGALDEALAFFDSLAAA